MLHSASAAPSPVLGVLSPACSCSLFRVHLRCPRWEGQQRGQQKSSGLGWRKKTCEDDSCKAIHHQAWAVSVRSCSLCLLPKLLWGHPTVLGKTPIRQTLPSLHQCGLLTHELYKTCEPARPRLLLVDVPGCEDKLLLLGLCRGSKERVRPVNPGKVSVLAE